MTCRLSGLGVAASLRGDLPSYLLEYLRKYFDQYYELTDDSEASPADVDVTISLDGSELSELAATPGRSLGMVPLDLWTRGQLVALETGTLCALTEDGRAAIAEHPDGSLTLAAVGPDPTILQHFVVRLDTTLIAVGIDAGGLAPIHASAVTVGGSGVLICGSKGSGKTSLALAIATQESCSFVSNELALVGTGTAGLTVLGTPIPPRLGAGTLRAHPRLLDALDPYLTLRAQLAPSDWTEVQDNKVDVTVRTISRALDLRIAPSAPLRAVIWPQIADGDEVRIEQLSVDEATQRGAASMLLFDPHWLGFGRWFNGLPPLAPPIERSLEVMATVPNLAACGARRVDLLARAIVDLLA